MSSSKGPRQPGLFLPMPGGMEKLTPQLAARLYREQWYPAYPRHTNPDAGERAFTKILTENRASLDDLLAGARRYAAYCEAEHKEEQFIQHPATFLNAGGWKNTYNTQRQLSPAEARAAALSRAGQAFMGRLE